MSRKPFQRLHLALLLLSLLLASMSSTSAQQAQPTSSSNGVRNGLPPTNLDSFVHEAGGQAELIYGDEGVDGAPPYKEFDQTHRINAGITGITAVGLTTGHSSVLPNGVGGDEFVKTESWSEAVSMSNNAETLSGDGESNSSPIDLGNNSASPTGGSLANLQINLSAGLGSTGLGGDGFGSGF